MAKKPSPDVGRLPFTEALEAFRQRLGNQVTTSRWDDMLGDAHAQSFTIAGATKAELLNDLGQALRHVKENGGSLNDFRKSFDDIVKRHGWSYNGERGWRTKIIFETNVRTSAAAGRYQQFRRLQNIEAKRGRKLYLMYQDFGDDRVRPQHRAWNGTILPFDHPWWDIHYPPNDFGCRCSARSMTERRLKANNLTPTSDAELPESRSEDRINPSTGEIYPNQTPGIGTGWNYHPGKAAWFPDPRRMADDVLGHTVARLSVSSRNFEKLVSGDILGTAPVGYVDDELATALKANTKTVVISDATMTKQRDHHPELTVTEYQLLPDMIENGLVIQQVSQRLMFLRSGNRIYRAIVKSTKDGNQLFIVSFHRTDAKRLNRDKKKGQILREEKE